MFTADSGWVGLVVALATVALRLYLREVPVKIPERTAEAIQRQRQYLWDNRFQVCDDLLQHEQGCTLRVQAEDFITLVGWLHESFVMATLTGERSVLDEA